MKNLITFLFAFLIGNYWAFAQITDNFSDGNFTANPTWLGDDSLFIINANNELQSNGPNASSTLYLSTANILLDSTEWNILVKLGFNPSSTNYVRIYLVSDNANLKGNLNGYFIQLGEAGTNADSINFFKQTGNTITNIFRGISACMANTSSENVRLKVTRNNAGLWKIFSDCNGGNNFINEGQFTDNSFTTTQYFGIQCRYSTGSRFDKYFFDDISISNIIADTLKPTVQAVEVIDANKITIQFSEEINGTSANLNTNYFIDNGIGNPIIAQRDTANSSLVRLQLNNTLQNNIAYNITIQNIEDESGNIINTITLPLVFYLPQSGDIAINEIFADPTPQVNLPNGEFIELKNNKNFPVNISGWIFSDASTNITLPNATIPADSFMVLCNAALIDSFAARGFNNILFLPLPSLPSLNNSSDSLQLKDNNGNLIDEINYTDNWYDDVVKDDGGWSLERIDATTSCGEGNNWKASINTNGGTPGKENSIANVFIDNTSPEIINYEIISTDSIKIFFSESVNSIEAASTTNYTLNNGVGNPQQVIATTNNAILIFANALDTTLLYQLIADNIFDCKGNEIIASPLEISFPQTANVYDIIITEIFADPEPQYGLPEYEFIELYNASNKSFSLKNWQLTDATSQSILADKTIAPQTYLVLCPVDAISNYAAFGNVLGVQNFPSLNNTEDLISIVNDKGKTIHQVNYNDTWYKDNIKKEGGYSLEMIDLNYPCIGNNNWKASDTIIGGTPATFNSVNAVNPDNEPFVLINAWAVDSLLAILNFNKPLENAIINTNQIIIEPSLTIDSIWVQSANVFIHFSQALSPKTIYEINVNNIKDCSGNNISENMALLGLPENADSADVVINEILFNPQSSGSDFIELYNRSNKIIDLKNFIIAEADYTFQDSVIDFSKATDEHFLLFPEMYAAISADAANIKSFYFSKFPKNILQQDDLPNYNDDDGVVVLLDTLLKPIDKVAYTKAWHHPMIDDENGVSLERINFNRASQEASNWHSAASTVGFATPAYENSQYLIESISDETITLQPEAISPNNDGFQDFLNIQYQLKEIGFTANIQIFDAAGRLIKNLVRNELLATEGIIKWNGDTDEGDKALIGIYIIYIELFNAKGEVKKYKKSCVVAGNISK